jgi:hypothetical protein
MLNLGLLFRAIAEPVQSLEPNELTGWLLVISAALQFAGGLTFVINSWSRVKAR